MGMKEGRYITGSSECLVVRPSVRPSDRDRDRLPLSSLSTRPDSGEGIGWLGPAMPARLKTGRNEASLQTPILIECFLIPTSELQRIGRAYETGPRLHNPSTT